MLEEWVYWKKLNECKGLETAGKGWKRWRKGVKGLEVDLGWGCPWALVCQEDKTGMEWLERGDVETDVKILNSIKHTYNNGNW